MSNMMNVRMVSFPMLNTPNFLEWCSHGFRTTRKKAEKASFIRMIVEGYNIPEGVVIDLFRGKIKWSREGTSVTFKVEAHRMRPWMSPDAE